MLENGESAAADSQADVAAARLEWEQRVLGPALNRFGLKEPPDAFYAPDSVPACDFLKDVGFPGQYPFTAGPYATDSAAAGGRGSGQIPQGAGLKRAGRYSGYGGPEDSAAYYQRMIASGQRAGPNVAFDLPTQCGYDSDHPMAQDEVGRTGVAIDSMDDFRTLYAPFTGHLELDHVASNWTINAPAVVIVAMYYLLARERGLDCTQLRGTPQNDILKEFIARGTYIFPPEPSMRLTRDLFLFCTKNLPAMNVVSAGGYHLREAGATREQDLGFSMANAVAYLDLAVAAGIDIDTIAARFSFNAFGGSLELFPEVAFQRAARRIWARIVRERFGAKAERSWVLRQPSGAHMGYYNATVARPLNNLTRAVIGAIAGAMSGYAPVVEPPFDEALGLGWSAEAMQLSEDAGRILTYEAKLTDVRDPLAGSYYIESLTDDIEARALTVIEDIDARGGAVANVDYMRDSVSESAVDRAWRTSTGERVVVGVNAFVGEGELEVQVRSDSQATYERDRLEEAESRQIDKLRELRRRRSTAAVDDARRALWLGATRREVELVPLIVDCLRADCTIGEICDSLRDVFGEYSESRSGASR